MTDDRERILAGLRASLGRLERRTPYPDYEADVATPPDRRGGGLDAFRARLAAAGTVVLDGPADLVRLLQDNNATTGYCDPALQPRLAAMSAGGIDFRTEFDRNRLDEFRFGITRASAGIAETGTLVLTDRDTPDRLAAVAPWVHVACLDRRRLYGTLAEALEDLGDDPNVILVSGHSQTADVEGIMIHGVHGPGVQACLLLEPEAPTETDP